MRKIMNPAVALSCTTFSVTAEDPMQHFYFYTFCMYQSAYGKCPLFSYLVFAHAWSVGILSRETSLRVGCTWEHCCPLLLVGGVRENGVWSIHWPSLFQKLASRRKDVSPSPVTAIVWNQAKAQPFDSAAAAAAATPDQSFTHSQTNSQHDHETAVGRIRWFYHSKRF